jgi:epoxyqueuosine reductase
MSNTVADRENKHSTCQLLAREQWATLAQQMKSWSAELGFQQCGITDTSLGEHGQRLQKWLANDYHGKMEYMASHGDKRFTPQALVPGTSRIIVLRMNYWPKSATASEQVLSSPESAFISRYTLGRDYHKLMRKRLTKLAARLQARVAGSRYRVFTDSAPVLEKALAEKARLGWIGKNTMLINPKAGSYFFLGEIFTDIPLPLDKPFEGNHCGSCSKCLDTCPTNAFAGPHMLDARRCISYLTIELKGSIPEDLRPLMGNRIFGCDDCQLVCPWNKFTQATQESDFNPRHQLDQQHLISLFSWTENDFLSKTAGTAIRRAGYESWLRNIAVALGNGPATREALAALNLRVNHPSDIVREHVQWALTRLLESATESKENRIISTV